MSSNGRYELFLSMVESNKGIIYKIANSFCRDNHHRNDLVQDILLRLWQSFDSYDRQHKQSTWVYRVALNVAISLYRREKTRTGLHAPMPDDILTVAEVEASSQLEHRTSLLALFIAELPELDRALLILYLEEKVQREIAEIMGMTETNVATRIGRIKEKLRKRFLQHTND